MSARPSVLITLAFALGFVLSGQLTAVQGDDFRIETEVFLADEQEPACETLTIFAGDVVYDFLLSPSEEITVFDVRRGRIVLLDPKRQIKTTLTTEKLQQFSEALKAHAPQPRNRGLFNPDFATNFDDQTGELALTSERLSYRVKTVTAPDSTAARRYHVFADWYARLNAARGNVPPFGRLALNRALAERNLFPEEIERTTVTSRKMTARSRHTANWLLSNTDGKRIDRAGRFMASFREVGLSEYWQSAVAAGGE